MSMSLNNLFPTILMFLYLLIIFLMGYYKNLKNKNINDKINIKTVDIPISFYCYNNSSIKELFYLTFLNLIDKKYYILYDEDHKNYIKINKNKKINDLKGYELVLTNYIDNLIKDAIEIDSLEYLIDIDCTFSININKFYMEIKKDSKEIYGKIDKLPSYIFSIIFGVLYFMQMLYFIYNKFSIIQLIVVSIPLTFITIILCDKIKNNILKFNFKRIILITILSFIIAIISCLLWISMNNFNYIVFHFMMALITFMYPLFVIINIYFIKTNTYFLNIKQKNIINELNSFLNELLNNNKLAKKYYIYSKAYKINVKSDNELMEYFVHTFSI